MSKEDGIKNQFEKFCEAFKRANLSDQKKGVQKLAIKEWNQLKASLVENPNAILLDHAVHLQSFIEPCFDNG